jgi:3-deoxy-D-manno-octulosonate 8-phosphate phosphatase (KDO 8-P phosphatase)
MRINSDENWTPRHLILDIDGVFTDGKIYYSEEGKIFKVFGPDDHDAIDAIREKLTITTVSADSSGLAITKRRVEGDLNLEFHLVGSKERASWIEERFDPSECVYMGDGIFDPMVFKAVRYSIAPRNASLRTRSVASFVTETRGSEGAVSEAIIHLADKFFGGFDNLKR